MPAQATTLTFVGHVRPVCQVATTNQFDALVSPMQATVAIFCNSSEGATVSATLLDGDSDGYFFSVDAGSTLIKPGESSPIIRLATAYRGSRMIDIAPLSADGVHQSPVVVFAITAD